MESKRSSSTAAALFLSMNLVLFVVATGSTSCVPPAKPSPHNSLAACPRDALKLGVCAHLLNGAVGAVVGKPPDHPCCSVLQGLVDLEVGVCLCTAIKANILGININIPISLSLLVNTCGKQLPSDFQCA